MNERDKAIKAQAKTLGRDTRDFLIEFWAGIARPIIPTEEDFTDLVEPYVEFNDQDAQEWLIKELFSEKMMREARSLYNREYMEKIQHRKAEALEKINFRKLKRRFENPRLPNHDR